MSRSSSFTYSNWQYPFVFFKDSSVFPFPHKWMIWKSFSRHGRLSLTALFTTTEPRLPPITRITGLSAVNLQRSIAAILLPERSSCRIGEPVRTAFPSGRQSNVSGKLQHIFAADGIAILLARPGVISDSWMITGTLHFFPASTTGTDTNPPFEKMTSGFKFLISLRASPKPLITRKGSVKFCKLK